MAFQYNPKLQVPLEEQVRQYYISQDPALAKLTQAQAQTRGQLYSAPFQAQQDYSNIFNPMERQKLISQAVGNVLGQLSGYNTLLEQRGQRSTDLAKNYVGYLSEQNAQKEAQAKAAQQQFENTLALQKYNLDVQKANKGNGSLPEDPNVEGFVSTALDNASNPNFDFTTFLSSVPQKQRNKFLSEYNNALKQIQSTPTTTTSTPAPSGGGFIQGVSNFFQGIHAPKVSIPSVPNVANMTPKQIADGLIRGTVTRKQKTTPRRTVNVFKESPTRTRKTF